MQCPNCQFENMPGTTHCGRCSMLLGGGRDVQTIEPPRAPNWAKRLRPFLPRTGYYGLRDRLHDARQTLADGLLDQGSVTLPTLSVLLRMIVPGWAHRQAGFNSRGLLFFAGYTGLMLIALVCLGSTIGMAALGFAFSVHASSIVDLLFRSAPRRSSHLVAVTVVLVAALFGLYYRAALGGSQWIMPRRIAMNAGPFAAGDVVIASPNAYATQQPQIGDIVAYNFPRARVATGRNAYLDLVGERIDRIVAGPGSEITFDGEVLRIDGKPAEHLPLAADRIPKGLKVQIPVGHYGILPSTDPTLARRGNVVAWVQVSSVPLHSIAGKVYVRHYPLWRWWWLAG